MVVLEVLDNVVYELAGGDRSMIEVMKDTSRWRHEERCPSHIWADYFFLSACYAAACGKKRTVENVIVELKENFPNYDPCSRFNKGKIFHDMSLNEDIKEERLKVVDKLEGFVRTHMKFSFSDSFSQYFGDVSFLDNYVL